MILTGKEILKIAKFAGFKMHQISEKEKEELLESKYQFIEKYQKKYILSDEYPDEGFLEI